jgi:hypothetical protein
MKEPDWKTLPPEKKLDRLHDLIHALIRHVDDIGVKVNRLQQRLAPTSGGEEEQRPEKGE